MAQTIKLKRSAQSGASGIPSTSDLALGEVGINTYHGKMYIKKDDGTESIVEVGGLPLSGGTLTGNLNLGDGVSANFGASNDLTITHTGSSSILKENGTGTFYIQGTDIVFTNSAGSERYADFTDNGAVRLYHDNSIKLSTTSTGADITGVLTADGLTVDLADNSGILLQSPNTSSTAFINFGDSASSTSGSISYDHYTDALRFKTVNTERLRLSNNGDISFYNDSANQGLFFDSSTSRLGLGTTAPSEAITILDSTNSTAGQRIKIGYLSGNYNYTIGRNITTGHLDFIGTNSAGSSYIGYNFNGSVTSSGTFLKTGTNGNYTIASNGNDFYYGRNGANYHIAGTTNGAFNFLTGASSANRLKIASNGDISFYNDSAAQAFHWDSSTSRLGLGVTNPANKLEISGGNIRIINQSTGRITFNNGSTEAYFGFNGAGSSTLDSGSQPLQIQAQGSNYIQFDTNSAERLKINADGSSVFSGAVTSTGLTVASTAPKITIEDTDATSTHTKTELENSGGNLNLNTRQSNGTFVSTDYQILKNSSGATLQRWYTHGTEAFRLDSNQNAYLANGSLMVGSTTAPSGLVHVASSKGSGGDLWTQVGAGNTSAIHIQNTANAANTNAVLYFRNSVGEKASVGARFVNQSTGETELRFSTTNSSGTSRERVTIDGDGSVGIGVVPSANSSYMVALQLGEQANLYAHTDGVGAGSATYLSNNITHNSGFKYINADAGSQYTQASGAHKWSSFASGSAGGAATENTRMTLTSGGDLLVGTTSVSTATQGIKLRSDIDAIAAVADGQISGYFGRLNSDGDILNFRKDSTTVGSIGTIFSDLYIGTGDTNLRFDDSNDALTPRGSGGSARDAAVDLGISSVRFKDLYLSGNATAQKLTLTKAPVGTYSIEVDGTNTGQPNLIVKQSTSERLRIDNLGRVGIGTSSPDSKMHLYDGALHIQQTDGSDTWFGYGSSNDNYITTGTGGVTVFREVGSEKMRLSGGNLLVGKTSTDFGTAGSRLSAAGEVQGTVSGSAVAAFNRLSNDGEIATFWKDTGQVGSIGTLSYNSYIGTGDTGILFAASVNSVLPHNTTTNAARDAEVDLGYSSGGTQRRFKDLYLSGSVNIGDAKTVGHGAISLKYDLVYMTAGVISPSNSDGTDNDNSVDLGKSAARFDDIFATNGTIQTSDRNEKQDIESLTEAEERVAVAAKGLLKKFRWKNAVEDKGDDARIHFGIIAQDLQDAFEAEGLDAGRYGMFTSNTWTNEDGEEQTRMGVRYSELLAFIISAI